MSNQINTPSTAVAYLVNKAVIERDSVKLHKIIDQMSNPDMVPFIAHIGAVGHNGHRWAWDQLEQWQYMDCDFPEDEV